MSLGVIYKILFPSGKVYIGQTKNFQERKQQHYRTSLREDIKLPVYKAIRKYGWESLQWEIIDKADSQEELNNKEKEWITYYKSYCGDRRYNNGYNATIGGEGHNTTKFEIADIEKVKEIHQEHPDYNASQIHKELCKYNSNSGLSISYIRNIVSGTKLSGITGLLKISKEESQERMKTGGATQLTKEQAIEIAELYKDQHLTPMQIYKITGYANPKAISGVTTGLTWSEYTHLPRKEKRKVNFITEEDVDVVLQLKKQGMSQKDISAITNIPRSTLGNIFRGESWSWYTGIVYIPQNKKQHKESLETAGLMQ